MITSASTRRLLITLAFALAATTPLRAADQPQWGQAQTRNMISAETGLPDTFDPATGKNIKWKAQLGTQTYATPVIAGGKVFIGTNNDHPRDPAHTGDRAILLCLDEKDGSLLWQFVCPKLSAEKKDPYLDWSKVGFCSPPTVEGDRVYMVTNRNEVVCLDINGLKNGNDGPFKGEARHMTPKGVDAAETLNSTDADILWIYDMPAEFNGYFHDSPHTSILIQGRYLYVNTNNGIGYGHKGLRNPDGPALIVLDKETGRIVAMDKEGIGHYVFHCNWSSPAVGEAGGRKLIYYCCSTPWLRAFEPVAENAPGGTTQTLKLAWKLLLDPASPTEGDMHAWLRNRKEGPGVVEGLPVFDNGRIYVSIGGDIWWGKTQSWLKCVDAANGKMIWSSPLESFGVSTPSVKDGLAYITDCGGNIHCIDTADGKPVWTQQAAGDFWGSTLVADGKVYAGSRKGDFWILAAGREKKVIGHVTLPKGDGEMNGTPVAANGTLYVTTMKTLYALRAEK